MTDPAITRLAEFTKRLKKTEGAFIGALVGSYYTDPGDYVEAIASLCADLTHVLAELERLNPNMAGWTAEEVADIRAHHAAQPRQDEEPK